MEIQDFARRTLLERCFQRVRIARLERAQRRGENSFPCRRIGVIDIQERNRKVSGEWIGRGAQDGHVVIAIDRDDLGGHKTRRRGPHAEKQIRLAAMQLAEDVRGGDQIAVAIDEETVAVEKIVITPRPRIAIDLIHDGTERGGKLVIVERRRGFFQRRRI